MKKNILLLFVVISLPLIVKSASRWDQARINVLTDYPADFKWYYFDSIPTKELERKAKKNNPTAMHDYGMSLWDSADEKKMFEGIKWIKKAAELNCIKSLLFFVLNNSDAIAKEIRYDYAERIFNSQDGECIYMVGMQWKYNIPNNPRSNLWDWDNDKAIIYLNRAAALHYSPALYDLGLIYCFGGIPCQRDGLWGIESWGTKPNYETSYRLFIESGASPEEYNLWALRTAYGNEYEILREDDKNRAQKMFDMLYKNGYLPAGVSLAHLSYENTDYKVAFEILSDLIQNHSKFIEEKSFPGILYLLLAKCYRFGRGCETNEELADLYTKKALGYGINKSVESLIQDFIDEKISQ